MGQKKIRIWTLFRKCEIKFLRDQVASKGNYFHEEIRFLRQQLETAYEIFKQENSNVGFCNNHHGQHTPSNMVNSDDSFIMTDYHTRATGSNNNMQTDSYINNKKPTKSQHHLQQKIQKKIIRHRTFQHHHHLPIRIKHLY